ncbi:hypothetical protein AB205_0170400 [Aquarana catesbeiana]|uniref:Uncharacterized protein n=1 Tax=Aquarana catesbeiana TaxID=8400 RepID=A0A2G9SHT7_AQUCT|nr:hypothetical protein AB205_0170400 [Aquarana catesbeiana]
MNLLTFSSSTVNNEWVCSIDMRNLNFVYSQFKHIVFVCCDFYKDQIIWIMMQHEQDVCLYTTLPSGFIYFIGSCCFFFFVSVVNKITVMMRWQYEDGWRDYCPFCFSLGYMPVLVYLKIFTECINFFFSAFKDYVFDSVLSPKN